MQPWRRFHEVEPQADLEPLPQPELSKMVVTRAKRTVPYPILGENTLVCCHRAGYENPTGVSSAAGRRPRNDVASEHRLTKRNSCASFACCGCHLS